MSQAIDTSRNVPSTTQTKSADATSKKIEDLHDALCAAIQGVFENHPSTPRRNIDDLIREGHSTEALREAFRRSLVTTRKIKVGPTTITIETSHA